MPIFAFEQRIRPAISLCRAGALFTPAGFTDSSTSFPIPRTATFPGGINVDSQVSGRFRRFDFGWHGGHGRAHIDFDRCLRQ
jgi:hypothetical protein